MGWYNEGLQPHSTTLWYHGMVSATPLNHTTVVPSWAKGMAHFNHMAVGRWRTLIAAALVFTGKHADASSSLPSTRSSRALGHVPDPSLPPPPSQPPAPPTSPTEPYAPPPPPLAPPPPPSPPPPPLPPLVPAPAGYDATVATADALYNVLNGTSTAAIFLQPGSVLHFTKPVDFFAGEDIQITSDPDDPATIDGGYITQLFRLSGASLRISHVHLRNASNP